jgi:glucosamine-6-phosphate deaminase
LRTRRTFPTACCADVEIVVVDDAAALAVTAADLVVAEVRRHPDAIVLAATGDTPMGCYAELARRRAAGGFDSSRVRIAQLDEYVGIGEDDPRSLYGWMRRSLCDPLAIGPERTIRLAPDGDPSAACEEYEAEIAGVGGIDLAVLGLGPNGHLGFNEPPTEANAPTRAVELTPASIESNARYWGTAPVPKRAVTAGMSLILAARRVLLLVAGPHKRAILDDLRRATSGPLLPASWLHQHPDASVIADRAAADVE